MPMLSFGFSFSYYHVCVCVCVSSILFVVLWISWICDLASDIILRNSQSLLLQIVCLFLYPFILLPVFSLHICYTFVVVHSSWMFCSHFSQSFYSLLFSFRSFCCHVLKLKDFPDFPHLLMSTLKAFFMSLSVFFFNLLHVF